MLQTSPGINKNAPDRIRVCQGRIIANPRCHLASRPGRALCRIPAYPRQLTYASTSQATPQLRFTAPSAAHLTTCFSPDSQQHRLSVKASSPLSPLQRFEVFGFLHYSTVKAVCQPCFLPGVAICLPRHRGIPIYPSGELCKQEKLWYSI